MRLLLFSKNTLVIFFLAFMINSHVFAQVSSNRMVCNSVQKNIQFIVRFNGNNATLELKGHTYQVTYRRSFISTDGERYSQYTNNEIIVETTFPYDTYVVLHNHQGNHIAGAFCR